MLNAAASFVQARFRPLLVGLVLTGPSALLGEFSATAQEPASAASQNAPRGELSIVGPLTAEGADEPSRASSPPGAPPQARLAGIADGRFQFELDNRRVDVPLAELVAWGSPSEPASQSRIAATEAALLVLHDASIVPADVLGADDDQLTADSRYLGELAIPLPRLAGLLLRPPTDAVRRDEALAPLLEATQPAAGQERVDRLVLENGDVVRGNLKQITPDRVSMASEGSQVQIDARRVTVVQFNPALLARPRQRGLMHWVGLDDGTLLRASELQFESEPTPQLRLQTALGEVRAPLQRITFLQSIGGQARYLSDLEPIDYRHIPFLSVSWPYARDRNVLGTRLRHAGRQHLKGLGMHSTSRLTYDLPEGYTRFEASLALDDRAGSGGSVTYRVFADNREVYRSEVIRGRQPAGGAGSKAPLPISVDVTGARRLSLVVDFAERGSEMDHANWLDARLVP